MGKLTRRSPNAIKQLKKLAQLSLLPLSFDQKIEEEGKVVTELFYGDEAKKAIQTLLINHENSYANTFYWQLYRISIPSFGGIGHGIYTVQLNTENGELSTLHTERARNPSYLTISHDNRFLYCNTELDENENQK